MPIYEYRCRQCAGEFELLVLPGSPEGACPSCESHDLEQLLSGFAVTSSGISRANTMAERRSFANSRQQRDQKVAQTEYYQKEHKEHREH